MCWNVPAGGLADLFRRHRRRGAEAALSGRAGRPARLAPRLRAGAVAARRDAGGAGSVLSLAAWVGTAAATVAAALAGPQVDVALVLAVDVSDSMDAGELAVQRAGYVAALSHPDFLRAVSEGESCRATLTYFEWAGGVRRELCGRLEHHRRARECRPLRREAGGAAVPDLPQHVHFERAGLRPAASRRQRGDRRSAGDRHLGRRTEQFRPAGACRTRPGAREPASRSTGCRSVSAPRRPSRRLTATMRPA